MAVSSYTPDFINKLRIQILQSLQSDYPQGLSLYETLDIVEKRLRTLLEFGKITEGKIPTEIEMMTKNGL